MISAVSSGDRNADFHQSLGDLKYRCDSLQHELTAYGPPPSLSVAMVGQVISVFCFCGINYMIVHYVIVLL